MITEWRNWTWDGPEVHGVQGLARHIADGSGTWQVQGTVFDFIDHLRSLGYDRLESPDPRVLTVWLARLDFEAAAYETEAAAWRAGGGAPALLAIAEER